MTEARLKEIEGARPEDEIVRELLVAVRHLQEEMAIAPTLEQMHSLVAQLKEVRGENSKLREELQRLQKAR